MLSNGGEGATVHRKNSSYMQQKNRKNTRLTGNSKQATSPNTHHALLPENQTRQKCELVLALTTY